jgi:sugar lactone lactonase YvrE
MICFQYINPVSEGALKKILFLFFIFLLNASSAFAKFDPAFTWTTLETPHFYIHYHQGEEEIAKRAAVIAEDVHARLVPRIKWDPKGRTHLVLVDAMDDSNGETTPQPYNHITLFITPPLGEPGFGTMAYDEWMRLLITHEYTHILHLDMVNGVPDFLQSVFGRFYFPNQFEPIWMIEGLAVYEETEQTGGGRGRSPGSDMIIRMAVLEDRFPRLSQATAFPDFWPAGDVPYLFGESFTRFIVSKYGREKLADVYVAYSRHGVPWLVDANGKRVLGTWYSDLWKEWHDELTVRYGRTRNELTAKGLTASLELTKRGYLNTHPAFSPDGSRIAYLVSNADEFPGIYVMNADGTGDHKLVENTTSSTSSGGSLAWSPDGAAIYYTKLDAVRNTNLYNDIYLFDLKKNREVRVTRGLRARDPSPSPDGKNLVFVTSGRGKTQLATLKLPSVNNLPVGEKGITYLTEESANQYDTPRYSPDGSLLAVGVWQPGGFKDIWVLDASGNKIEELMHDRAIDGGAAWSPDGKVIYFASDRTGIFNLFAYERTTRKIYQVTNVLGGAFTPAPSPDGNALVFTSYSSRGYDLHMRPADTASWKLAEPFKDPYPVITYVDKPVETKTSSYNPLPSLYPRFWIPWYGSSSASGSLYGFLTFGQDAVERHAYTLTGLYSPKTSRKWYSFNYQYDGLYPTFQVSASDVDGTFSDLLSDPVGTRDYVQREKTLDVALVFPLLKIQSQHAVAVGYRRREISALSDLPPWPAYSGVVPAEGKLVSGRVSYVYNSAKQYGFSISPEEGRTVELGYEQLDKSLGSDYSIKKYTADWHEYLNLPWKHHVLQARAFGGTSQGDIIPQRAYQIGGDFPGDSMMAVDDNTIYLRGYPVNAFRGQKAALASLEYRFPLADIEVGSSSTPFFFRRLHGALFGEAGNAWDTTFETKDLKRSFGAELRLDVDVAYQFPLTFRLVAAKGLDEKGESNVYLSIWMPSLF